MSETSPIEKRRQMAILEERILSCDLIDAEILREAKKHYLPNPFHNFLHALCVASYVLELPGDRFTGLEKRSMLVAALFHDAGHTGVVRTLDEFLALDIIEEVLEKSSDFIVDRSIIRNCIMGTVFRERGKRENRYSVIMSDFDIGYLGKGIESFLYYGPLFALELDVGIEDFFLKTEKGYFKYLLSIHKEIFISQEARTVLPFAHRAIKDFYLIDLDTKKRMFETLLTQDITLEEFSDRFF